MSGLRVVAKGPPKAISSIEFQNYGSHCDDYPHLPYFTVAAAIGMRTDEIDKFLDRLEKGVLGWKKEKSS